MTRLPAILFFVAMTFLCWGTYGPVLHIGQEMMEHSRWRPFICVGMAYFIIAVLGPWLMMSRNGEQGRWTMSGIIWSFGAGVITAIGALGIILAFNFGGKPVYVMPLVFGCSPVVNTLVTMCMTGSHKQTRWPFYVAILLVALGAAGVFIFKPKPVKATPAAAVESIETTQILLAQSDDKANEKEATTENSKTENDETEHGETSDEHATTAAPESNLLKVLLSVLTTVVCWGSYGPLLHRGQVKMGNSRLRPFICVGLAYFLIAVLVPIFFLYQYGEPGRFGFLGTIWSLVAGALGAFGSLGIILAFTSGGKPVYVMPLIFGMAPVINTLTSMGQSYYRANTVGDISKMFIVSLCLVIVGAVSVLIFAPKNKPKPPPADPTPPSDSPTAAPPTASAEDASSEDASSSENGGNSE